VFPFALWVSEGMRAASKKRSWSVISKMRARKIKHQISQSLLKRLFKGETLEGYVEAARVKTLENW